MSIEDYTKLHAAIESGDLARIDDLSIHHLEAKDGENLMIIEVKSKGQTIAALSATREEGSILASSICDAVGRIWEQNDHPLFAGLKRQGEALDTWDRNMKRLRRAYLRVNVAVLVLGLSLGWGLRSMLGS